MFNKPQLELDVYEIPKDLKSKYWEIFKKHHYLDGAINKGARCWVAYLWGNPVAFNSVLAMPSGSLKRAWREHRLVVLSDYQGMGIGSAMSECVGEILLSEDKRFFSKTANIKLGFLQESVDHNGDQPVRMESQEKTISKAPEKITTIWLIKNCLYGYATPMSIWDAKKILFKI